MNCIHLGKSIDGNGNFECSKIGQTSLDWCNRCHLRQSVGRQGPDFWSLPPEFIQRIPVNLPKPNGKAKRIKPGPLPEGTTFVDKNREPINLKGLYQDGSLFLVLSGPSFRNVDHMLLVRRGIITMGVNNSPAVFRPHLWLHSDSPEKFHHGIWRDPGILKFCPIPYFRRRLRIKEGDEFKFLEQEYQTFPGVVGYDRNASFNPETYLSECTVNFGNSDRDGNPRKELHHHIINVMFAALKIPYVLGFRKVYLLGADFMMPKSGPIYSFNTDKHDGARASNNEAYLKLNVMLADLKPAFDAAGYQVYNATVGSGLRAFPTISLEEAIDHATAGIPIANWDTTQWYEPIERPAKK